MNTTTTTGNWQVQTITIADESNSHITSPHAALLQTILIALAKQVPIKIASPPITCYRTASAAITHKPKHKHATILPFNITLTDDTITVADHPRTVVLHDPEFIENLARITRATIITHYKRKITQLKRSLAKTITNLNTLT